MLGIAEFVGNCIEAALLFCSGQANRLPIEPSDLGVLTAELLYGSIDAAGFTTRAW